MLQNKTTKMMWKVMTLTGLMAGLFLFNAGQATAQEDCKSLTEGKKSCWVKKAKSGERNLKGADLSGADLSGTNLKRTYLNDADLTGANLKGANLSDSILTGADLTDVDLTDANLTKAYLTDATLFRANLKSANLKNAYLDKTDMRNTDLTGANLTGADLTGTGIQLKVRITEMVCTVSDDEGPFNSADMIAFNIMYKAFRKSEVIGEGVIYDWTGKEEKTTPKGYVWVVNKEEMIDLNEFGRVIPSFMIIGKAVENDGSANIDDNDEEGYGEIKISEKDLGQAYKVVGEIVKSNFLIRSSDFEYRVEIEISIVAKPE